MSAQDPGVTLSDLLTRAGIGVAFVDHLDRITFANPVFQELLEIAPGAHRDICNRAREVGRKVERLAFEPGIGWVAWLAEPSTEGLTVKVHKASSGERELARLASEASTDPYSGMANRRALLLDIQRALSSSEELTLLLLEPLTTPGRLGLDVGRLDTLSQQVAAALQPRLGLKEELYRVSPIVIAVTVPVTEACAAGARAESLRHEACIASRDPLVLPGGLDFIGGLASSTRGAADASTMYQQACHALASERAASGLSCRWFSTT